MPYNKAPGCDNTKIEIFKAIIEDITPAITNLCNEEGKMVTRVEEVFYELLLKNRDVRECMNNRTIALIPHTCKILLRIVQ